MTKTELINKAKFKGMLILKKRNWLTDLDTISLFYDTVHYFDENMEEIGYIGFPGTKHETLHIFNPYRLWSKNILADYHITELY